MDEQESKDVNENYKPETPREEIHKISLAVFVLVYVIVFFLFSSFVTDDFKILLYVMASFLGYFGWGFYPLVPAITISVFLIIFSIMKYAGKRSILNRKKILLPFIIILGISFAIYVWHTLVANNVFSKYYYEINYFCKNGENYNNAVRNFLDNNPDIIENINDVSFMCLDSEGKLGYYAENFNEALDDCTLKSSDVSIPFMHYKKTEQDGDRVVDIKCTIGEENSINFLRNNDFRNFYLPWQ